jgi:peroxygenase
MRYDSEGRFRPQQLEDFFSKYDKDGKAGLMKWDVPTVLRGQLLAFDFFGGSAVALECELLSSPCFCPPWFRLGWRER